MAMREGSVFMDKRKRKILSMRFTEDTYSKVQEFANKDHRTFTGAVNHLLLIGLDCEEKEAQIDKP